jgi:hypothetical protein
LVSLTIVCLVYAIAFRLACLYGWNICSVLGCLEMCCREHILTVRITIDKLLHASDHV